MKRFYLIAFVALCIMSYVKRNDYPVVDRQGNWILVDRKGELIPFYSPWYEGNSVTLYLDYDVNYEYASLEDTWIRTPWK